MGCDQALGERLIGGKVFVPEYCCVHEHLTAQTHQTTSLHYLLVLYKILTPNSATAVTRVTEL